MEEDKITLDRETFKALAVETRVKILRILDERQHTLTDLAEELDMAPSTIKEHLDVLVAAGLIKQIDKGMKWKYYKLTSKGKQIITPYEKKVWIILTLAALTLSASIYAFITKIRLLEEKIIKPVPTARIMQEEGLKAADSLYSMEQVTETTVNHLAGKSAEIQATTPILEVAVIIISAVVLGFCIGYLKRKKAI